MSAPEVSVLLAWWAVRASATTTCGGDEILATLPSDGADGVSPDAVLAVLVRPGTCGSYLDAEATDADGVLQVTVDEVSDWLYRVRPAAPLSPGALVTVEVRTDGGTAEVSFTVGEGRPAPAEPASVTLEELTCAWGETQIRATLSFVGTDPASTGVLRPEVTLDGAPPHAVGPGAVYRGEPSKELTFGVVGSGELCASFALDDETGQERWRTTRVCLEEEIDGCRDTADGKGGGCSTAPGMGWSLAPLVGLLVRRHARSR